MTGRSNSLISLLSGAAAGALAMYLLDPEQGRQRRENLTESAGGALSGAGESLGRAWEHLSDQAKALSAAAAAKAAAAGEYAHDSARDFSRSDTVRGARDYASDAGNHLTSLGSDLLERVRGLGQRFAGGASDAASDASDRAREGVWSARRSLGSWVSGEEKESHLFAHTVGTAGVVALGAGAMYFLDPERGRARRAWAGQKVNKILNDTSRAFHQAGQSCADMMNRTRGTAHDLRQSVASGGPVSAKQLLQRVRSEMGHVVSHADQIQVMADAEGNVELTGRVLASELDTLLTIVRRVNGVRQITNRLIVLDREDQLTGTGRAGTAVPQM